MKRVYQVLSILVLITMVASCSAGEEADGSKATQLEELKSQRASLDAQINELEAELRSMGELSENGGSKILVTSLELKEQPFVHNVQIRGGVASKKNVMLSAETMGKIKSIPVSEGQRVSKGQLLISLGADVVRASIKQVKTQLDLADQVFERQERLWKKNIGTEIQYLQAKTNKESLESQLATLNSQLEMTQVTAPFSGLVDDIPARVGEVTSPGTPLIRLVNPDDAYIVAEVSESFLSKFRKGQDVKVYFPAQDKRIVSRIQAVSNTIKPQNRTFELEIELPKMNFPFQPNQVVVLDLADYTNEKALIVPTKLIQRDAKGNYVYVISGTNGDKRAEKAHVTIGKSYNLMTEILEGLKPGQVVANDGHRDLTDGIPVTISK